VLLQTCVFFLSPARRIFHFECPVPSNATIAVVVEPEAVASTGTPSSHREDSALLEKTA